jgi:arylsulfatase A-like enzyme
VSRPTARIASAERPGQNLNSEEQTIHQPSQVISLVNYALAGLAATFLLSFIEWVDLNIQLTPVFESASERLAFTSYFSLNLLAGSIIGLLAGLTVHAASFLKRHLQSLFAGSGKPRASHTLIAGLIAAALAAVLLNQQPQIHGFALALLREAEKFRHLAKPLLMFETLFSYLVVMGLFIGCSMAWMLARKSQSWPAAIRTGWLSGLLLMIGFAYYVDSRIEVQQYEYSMHRLMFLLDMTLGMALVASLNFSPSRLRHSKAISIIAVTIVFAGVAFNISRFDKNQNLKTQVFYRTTQAKQHFKLAQWALDFDRDGYSPYLGGGDGDDRRADINPGAVEIIGNGIDNNCLGGDLTEDGMQDWQAQFDGLSGAGNPSAKRLNVIYFFIDTLRDDHLGAYGYPRNTSPNIDKLAARSSVFDNAYTPSPYTYEAAPKFMQSTYWDARAESWTEVMARSGYKTILFPRRLSMLLRHVKGMEEIADASRKGLKQTIDAAIEVLGNTPTDRPFCAYIYSSDPHRPYRMHEGISFGSSLIDQYDGEIAYTDHHLGRLFDWMEKSGRMNDTMVVIMSDHGESFGERMVYKHNSQVYDEQMRVPMIVYVPNQEPRRIADYVSTVDLGTTILDLVGIDYGNDRAGVSLLPLMRGEPLDHPPIYGEHILVSQSPYLDSNKMADPDSRKYMVVTQDGFKLIYNRNFYSFELFNLKEDPRELRNLYDRMPEKAAAMKKLLGQFVDVVGARRPWDADEQKFYFGVGDDEEDKK